MTEVPVTPQVTDEFGWLKEKQRRSQCVQCSSKFGPSPVNGLPEGIQRWA